MRGIVRYKEHQNYHQLPKQLNIFIQPLFMFALLQILSLDSLTMDEVKNLPTVTAKVSVILSLITLLTALVFFVWLFVASRDPRDEKYIFEKSDRQIFSTYKPNRRFFEAIHFIKRLGISAIIVTFHSDKNLQLLTIIVIQVAYTLTFLLTQPH